MARRTVSAGKPYEDKQRHSPGVIADGRVLHTSGMVSRDAAGNLVGAGDMVAQVKQVFANLDDVFKAAGTDASRVVKYTIFVTDIDAFQKARGAVDHFFAAKPASTLLQISQLADPRFLVEVEAIVALD
ncbi:MAG: RidA family protein [Alphaproteobacteria bacterium]|nr:RidA family protein [Alphaproteobacteria bacterium]